MHINKRYFSLLFCIPLYLGYQFFMYLDIKTPVSFGLTCLFAIYITAATALLVIKPLVPKHIVFFGLPLFLFLLFFIQSETLKIDKKELLFYFVFMVPSLLLTAIIVRNRENLISPDESDNTEKRDIIQTLRHVFYMYLAGSAVLLIIYNSIHNAELKITFDNISLLYLVLIVCVSVFYITVRKREKETLFHFINRFLGMMLILIIYYALIYMFGANLLPSDLVLLFFPWFLCLFIILEEPRLKTAA